MRDPIVLDPNSVASFLETTILWCNLTVRQRSYSKGGGEGGRRSREESATQKQRNVGRSREESPSNSANPRLIQGLASFPHAGSGLLLCAATT